MAFKYRDTMLSVYEVQNKFIRKSLIGVLDNENKDASHIESVMKDLNDYLKTSEEIPEVVEFGDKKDKKYFSNTSLEQILSYGNRLIEMQVRNGEL